MKKILFITLADIESTSNLEQGYSFVSVQTMPFEHIESGCIPKDGDELVVSIDATSKLLYKCISSYTEKPFTVDGHDAVVSAKFVSRV